MLAQKAHDAELIAIADPELLLSRADALELPLHLKPFHADAAIRPQQAGELHIHPVELQAGDEFSVGAYRLAVAF